MTLKQPPQSCPLHSHYLKAPWNERSAAAEQRDEDFSICTRWNQLLFIHTFTREGWKGNWDRSLRYWELLLCSLLTEVTPGMWPCGTALGEAQHAEFLLLPMVWHPRIQTHRFSWKCVGKSSRSFKIIKSSC